MTFVKSLIFSLCMFTTATAATTAVAQELPLAEWTDFPEQQPIGPKRALPAGTVTSINKIEHTCFNTQEYKELLLYANDYQALYDWRVKTDAIVISWQNLDQIYLERLTNRKEQVDTLKVDRSYILKQLEDQRKYILNLQGRKDAAVVGWKVVAAVELLSIVALSITMAVK